MAKWQHIREAHGLRLNTVADLLMDDGKTVRATWREIAGEWCDGALGSIIAWLPADGRKWRGSNFIPLYTPLSFRIVAEGAAEKSGGCSFGQSRAFLKDNGLLSA